MAVNHMRKLASLFLVGFCAAILGCGDSKTQGPSSLKQEMPNTGKAGVDKNLKKMVER